MLHISSDRETQDQDEEPPQEVEIVGLNQYGLPENNIQNNAGDQLRASTFRLKREPFMSMIQRQGYGLTKEKPGRDFLEDKPGMDFLEEKRLKRNLLKRFFGEFRDDLTSLGVGLDMSASRVGASLMLAWAARAGKVPHHVSSIKFLAC